MSQKIKIVPSGEKAVLVGIITQLQNEKKSKELNHGNQLVGDVTQEFKLEKEIIDKSGWGKFLKDCVSRWIEIEMKKKITKFNLIDSWVVRQFKDEYNPVHWHGGHISGAGFLKIPETLGKHFQEKRDREYLGGRLTLIHGSRQFLSNSKFSLTYAIVVPNIDKIKGTINIKLDDEDFEAQCAHTKNQFVRHVKARFSHVW